jgi:hypothetical protein
MTEIRQVLIKNWMHLQIAFNNGKTVDRKEYEKYWKMISTFPPLDTQELERRRYIMNSVKDLSDVIDIFWLILADFVDENEILNEVGYNRFFSAIHYALTGRPKSDNKFEEQLRLEYNNHLTCYGSLTRETFGDIIMEILGRYDDYIIYYLTIKYVYNRIVG